jgi:hypothetical protein
MKPELQYVSSSMYAQGKLGLKISKFSHRVTIFYFALSTKLPAVVNNDKLQLTLQTALYI